MDYNLLQDIKILIDNTKLKKYREYHNIYTNYEDENLF